MQQSLKKAGSDQLVTGPRADIEPFRAMNILAEARDLENAGKSIVHLELGEPAVIAPASIQQAVIAAMAAGRTGYTQTLGLPTLRAAIAELYSVRHGLRIPAHQIAVTTGSSAAFILAFLACFKAGDRIGIPNPGYPAYRNILKSLDLVPVPIETSIATNYMMTEARLVQAETKGPLAGVLIMSPANPTGVTMRRSDIAPIANFCRERAIPLISDEIYHGLTHDIEGVSALECADDVIVVNSFSKYHAMTGWRVGWLVAPENRLPAIERLSMNLYLCPPTLSQIAAEAALQETDFYEAVRENYAAARDFLAEALPTLGLPVWPMDGAFYAYCDAGAYTNDSVSFCRSALHEAGLAMTPGVDFDPENGHRFIRISYAGGERAAREGVARLGAWLKR
jgi:aspartate/methionine/tyrosine aminotransferase